MEPCQALLGGGVVGGQPQRLDQFLLGQVGVAHACQRIGAAEVDGGGLTLAFLAQGQALQIAAPAHPTDQAEQDKRQQRQADGPESQPAARRGRGRR